MRHSDPPRGPRRLVVRGFAALAMGVGLILGSQPAVLAAGPNGGAATAISAAEGVRVAPAGVPPKPTGIHVKTLREVSYYGGGGYVKFRITWNEKAGAATSFKVIGLLRCVRESKANNNKPCIVPGTRLKSSDLQVIAKYGARVRSAVITIRLYGEVTTNALWGNSKYYGILVGAYNSHGESKLGIGRSSTVCWGCTY
jgi:hypothetical protein